MKGLQPISKSSVVKTIIAQLRRAIEDGVYPPGTHLNQEELAAAAGLSRTPIRQALLAVAREGLLEESTQGYRVVRLDLEEALDMFEVRGALEGVIARIAAKRATPAGIARLRKAAEKAPVFTGPAEDANDFHAITADIVGWPVLTRLRVIAHTGTTLARSEVLAAVHRGSGTPQEDKDGARREHRAIAEAIAAGDEELAERLVREHFHDGRDRLAQALGKNDKAQSVLPAASRDTNIMLANGRTASGAKGRKRKSA